MNLTTVFLFAICASASAKVFSQQVTLTEKNAPLVKVFKEINRQTGYTFVYTRSLLKKSKNISINVQNAPIKELLEVCFKEQPLTYTILNTMVVIKEKEFTPQKEIVYAPPPPHIITGTITNDKGQPLAGATILIKGTSNGTKSDANGNFSIDAETNSTLIISYVGYETTEVTISKAGPLKITLKQKESKAEEIVVIGYGTQNKKDLTGAVGQVKYESIKNLPLINAQQALQGQVSGVKVLRNSGEPGGNFSVYIRGVNSTSNSGQPLYVVDGVPLAAGSLTNLSPDDIESMDVLKDASASAIYGARAANGVVIITTKTGKKGEKTRVDFSSEVGLQTPILPFKMSNSFLHAQIFKESYAAGGLAYPALLDDSNFLRNNNHDWQKLASRNALLQRYNFSVSGGSDKTQFLLSAYLSNTQGVVIKTNYQNATFRLNIDHQASKKLKVGARITAGVNGGSQVVVNDFWGSPWRQVLFTKPWAPYKDAQGNWASVSRTGVNRDIAFNPIAEIMENDRTDNKISVIGNTYLEYEITKGLKFKYLFGGETYSERFYNFNPIYDRGDYTNPTTQVQDIQNRNINWVSDGTLTYDKNWNNINKITILLGSSAQRFDYRYLSVSGYGATNNQLNQISGQPNVTATGGVGENGLLSYFARVFYSFKNKYLINGTVRRDGSSRFAPAQKWGTFPSASLGWRMAEEPFMKNVRFISDMKWRVSYGLTGNQDIPSFSYLSLAQNDNYAYGNTTATGFAITNPANPFLKWESLKQFDAGLDISFFKGRISATFDYYNKISNDLLTNILVPPSSGFTGTLAKNIGSVKNRGFELGLNTINTTGALKWTTNFNFSVNKNEVLNLGLDQQGNPVTLPGALLPVANISPNLTTAGHPIGAFYGWIWDGIYQLGEEAKAASVDPRLKPGDVKFRDLNGDGKITNADRTFIGSPFPTFFGGMSNTLSYKNFTFSIFTDFAGGNKVLNTQRMFGESGVWNVASMAQMKDRWTPTNPSNKYPRATLITQWLNSRVSTNFLEKADFFRINNVALSYNLPKSLLNRIKVQEFSISLICNNLYTFTGYTGYNPETSSYASDPLSPGLDIGAYPLSRMYSLKFNISF